MKKNDFVEAIIVFSVMTGILLPVRLLFVSYVSDNWFGSFGIIAIISATMIILTKMGKLGKFGKMFERQINKFQHGKKGKIVYGQAILFLIILGGTIFAIEQGNSTHLELKEQILEEHQEFSDPNQIIQKTEQLEAQDWAYGFVGLFLAIFYAFPQLSAVFAVLNDSFDGWILHFYTVAFVEYIELFGILLAFRFFFKNKSKMIKNDTKPKSNIQEA